MIRDEIRELLQKHPFEPFSILATGGETYEIKDSTLVAVLKSAIFIAFPNSDRWVMIPFLHISSSEILNGRHRPSSGKRRR